MLATLHDEAGNELPVVWFNQAYLERLLKPDRSTLLAGPVAWDWRSHRLYLSNPQRDVSPGLHAIYPETEGITSRFLRRLIAPLLSGLEIPDPLSEEIAQMNLTQAFRTIHRPVTPDEAARARQRLEFDEHLMLQLALADRRAEARQRHSYSITPAIESLRDLVARLPFMPTPGQRQAAWTILKTLRSLSPTRHLLQGDVGSGKTLVALFVALSVLEAGQRVCWLVPTQVLARQLVARLQVLLKATRHRVGLVIASEDENDAPLLVGTHALLNRTLVPSPALVIIDEQQRFGVAQREQLTESDPTPHILAMTATPIPRTLALAVLGQDSLTVLKDRPHHQQPVRTARFHDRGAVRELLIQELTSGRQVFVVVPRIDGLTNTLFAQSIEAVAQSYQQLVPECRIGLLHGRLEAKEQERILEQFSNHDLDLLVATTIVEVGVDVPNATVMIIEEAAQFGLAQLHQLRGRVGRGQQPGYCVVLNRQDDEVAEQRLQAFVSSNDGFALARLDLELRGPGELLGTLQSGLPSLRLARLDDTLMIDRARFVVEPWLQNPPQQFNEWLKFHGVLGQISKS